MAHSLSSFSLLILFPLVLLVYPVSCSVISMANFADPKNPNTRAYKDPTSLETLQLSFENLRLKNGMFEIDGSGSATTRRQAQVNRVSSSLHLNGSLTGAVLPGPRLSNRENILDSSKIGSFGHSFKLMNLMNGAAENLTAKTLNNGYDFGAPDLFDGFSNRNPGLPSHPEAISSVFNGIVSPRSNWIITSAMTEDGSKYFQDLLLLKDSRIKKLIFERVIEYIFQLMTNQYGRYLFQKLIELEDENQLQMIMEKLTFSGENIYNASIDRYGSYSIKKLIKVLEKSPLVTEVVKALCNKFDDLMINSTGKYVIMECLDIVDSQKNDLLYLKAIENCLELARHERGCVSLNSFISRIKGPRRDQLLNYICNNVKFLAQDPTGNFVVQLVLELQNPAIVDKICSKLTGYYVILSMLKEGSHLVEKCLRSSGMDYVVHEFLQSNQLFRVAKDRYGNYVLQTALRETKRTGSPLHGSLVLKLEQHLDSLQHGYGRNILTLMTDTTVQFNKA